MAAATHIPDCIQMHGILGKSGYTLHISMTTIVDGDLPSGIFVGAPSADCVEWSLFVLQCHSMWPEYRGSHISQVQNRRD